MKSNDSRLEEAITRDFVSVNRERTERDADVMEDEQTQKAKRLLERGIESLSKTEEYKLWIQSHSQAEITDKEYSTRILLSGDDGWREALIIHDLNRYYSTGDVDEGYLRSLEAYLDWREKHKEKKRRARKKGEPDEKLPFLFSAPREVHKQLTAGRSKKSSIYDLIDKKNIEGIRELEEAGNLLNAYAPGIAVTPTQNLIIKAIQRELVSQSRKYKSKEGEGLPDKVITEEGLAILDGKDRGEKDGKKDDKEKRLYYVCLDTWKLTKEITGKDKPGGAEIEGIRQALTNLDNKFYYNTTKKVFYRLLTIEKVKGSQIYIACRPVFVENMEKNFIPHRRDEIKLLSPYRGSSVTIRLYDYLCWLYSFNLPTTRTKGYAEKMLDELTEKVAVNKAYDSNRGRLKADLEKAIANVVEIGIVHKIDIVSNKARIYFNSDFFKSPESEEGIAKRGR